MKLTELLLFYMHFIGVIDAIGFNFMWQMCLDS